MVTMGIGVANFFPKDKDSHIVDISKVPMFKWTTTENMGKINALIQKDLKENPELTRKILRDISSYKEESGERSIAEKDYIDDGISFRDKMAAIENSNCRQEFNSQLAPYKSWYDADVQRRIIFNKSYQPTSDLSRDLIRQEMYRRDIVNNEYLIHHTDLLNIFGKCTFSLRDSIPHLSRPEAKPNVLKHYIPEQLECVKKNGGDYNACYP